MNHRVLTINSRSIAAVLLSALCLPLSAMPSIERHSHQSSSVDSVAILAVDSHIIDSDAPATVQSDEVYFANRNYRALDMHLPCYLTTGLPLNQKPNAQNCDVKYQLSLRLNILRNMGGKHWDLFVSYSQVSVWSLYARSSPFYDNIYAPGISAYHPVIKGDRLIGEMQMGIEHQSNGKDDETSRSFNYAYFTYAQHLGNFTVQAKVRAGFGYVEDDIRDMHRYYGFGHIASTYRTSNGLFAAGLVVNPCDYFRKCNITAEAFLRLGRNLHAPYFFVQYYYGLEMPRQFMPDSWTPVSMIRFGIAIRPDKSNLY